MKRGIWFLMPPALIILGTLWMNSAVSHFERTTGRQFYALAGYHYTLPRDGFKYWPGGKSIERWTVTIPSAFTFVLLAGLGAGFTLVNRKRGSDLLGLWWWDVVGCAVVFFLITGWFSINVTGLFI